MLIEYIKVFAVGGVLCAIGQLLIFFFEGRGAGELAPVFASLCLVVLSAAAGIGAAVFFGIIIALLFRPKAKS